MPNVVRDGRSLFYRDEAGGHPPVVLVHGWCCDHTYMLPQLEHFAGRHRVIAPDLSGHGQSDKSPASYTIGGFADEVAWLADHLGLERPLVVGHSMGGAVALELAVRRPGLPAAIVILDNTVMPPPDRRARMEELARALAGPGYRDAMRQTLEAGFFSRWDDPDRKARIVEAMLSAPQHVIASAWEGILKWDGAAAIAGCTTPALYVAGAEVRTDLGRMLALCPSLITAQVAGAGHFMQLEVPDQVNAMLDRFFRIVGARA
jgi:pimeloyl-ACP methyl ester carboxylesterase